MKILVTGANGMLARALLPTLADGGHAVTALTRVELDVTDGNAAADAIARLRPDAVIQCAAYTRVDDAEHEEHEAMRINAMATAHVAAACNHHGARLVYPSTDYVFDGSASEPYPVDAPTSPINAYGRSKLAGEIAAATTDALVVRTSWLYGAGGRNFVRTIAARAREGKPLRVVDDQRGAPTGTHSLARMIMHLLERAAPPGTYHATNAGCTTWHGLACETTKALGLDVPIAAVASGEFPQTARRPAWSVLDCTHTYAITGAALPWQDALAHEMTLGLFDA